MPSVLSYGFNTKIWYCISVSTILHVGFITKNSDNIFSDYFITIYTLFIYHSNIDSDHNNRTKNHILMF